MSEICKWLSVRKVLPSYPLLCHWHIALVISLNEASGPFFGVFKAAKAMGIQFHSHLHGPLKANVQGVNMNLRAKNVIQVFAAANYLR